MGRTSGLNVIDNFGLQHTDPDNCWYDPVGRQIKACAHNTSLLSFDGDNVVSADVNHFFHGPGLDDALIGLARATNGSMKEFYWVTDGRGEHLLVADSVGRTVTGISNIYDGWQYVGTTSNASSFAASRQETTNAPGVSFFRNRLYDQTTGRWTQEDPLGVSGGLNLYQFNGNNPAMFSDPFGLCPDPTDALCQAFEATTTLLGGLGGFVIGGGTGLLEIATTGGLATPAAVATAVSSTGVGAVTGKKIGEAITNVLFSKGAGGEFRGGKKSERDADYERLAKERKPTRAQRTRIHEEIGKRKQGQGDLSPEELKEVFDDVMGPKK